MMSLFSSFDLSFFNLFFMIFSTVLMNLTSNIYNISMFSEFWKILILKLENFFFSLKPKKFNKTMNIMILSLMTSLAFMNLSSVASFNFALTSQLSLVLFIALSIWTSFMIFMISNMTKGLIMHCVPEGTPIYLTWFLFVIEIISNMIRPLTVTVRLVANILAGHLLMILLSNLVLKMPFMVVAYALLNVVELFVALIQSYIFVTMITLYYSELE